MKLLAIALAVCAAQSASAEETADCIAAGRTLSRVVEVLDVQAASGTVSRLGLVRILSRAGLASAYARDLNWPEDMTEALTNLRDLPNARDDGTLLAGVEARDLVVENAVVVAAGMPAQCPETEIPDFAPYID
jgi:hypothetical protein